MTYSQERTKCALIWANLGPRFCQMCANIICLMKSISRLVTFLARV